MHSNCIKVSANFRLNRILTKKLSDSCVALRYMHFSYFVCLSRLHRQGQWGFRGSKALKITTWDLIVIQVLEFSFILMLWTKNLVDSWNIMLNFSIFSHGGRWGKLSRCYFFGNYQNSKSFNPSELLTLDHFAMRHPV